MRRTALARKTPLRAKRWGIKYKPPRRLSKPQSDPARLAWVREQACAIHAGWIWQRGDEDVFDEQCQGRTEACHEGRKPGTSMKCPDSETMPMCSRHHRMWTDHTGIFKGWKKQERREWADARIAETTARYLSHGSRRA